MPFGLFGSDHSGQYYSAAGNAATALGNQAANYGNIGQQAYGQYQNTYSPQYGQDYQNLHNYLTMNNPYTATTNAAYLAQATNGMASDYARARANTAAGDVARGFGGDSSGAAGGYDATEAARLSAMAGARNNLAMQQIQNYQNRMQQAAALSGGAASDYYNRAMGAYGQQTGADQAAYQANMGVGNQLHQNYMQNIQALLGGAESLAGTFGRVGGMGAYGGGMGGYGSMMGGMGGYGGYGSSGGGGSMIGMGGAQQPAGLYSGLTWPGAQVVQNAYPGSL